jgi:hypothetical protein
MSSLEKSNKFQVGDLVSYSSSWSHKTIIGIILKEHHKLVNLYFIKCFDYHEDCCWFHKDEMFKV